MKYFDIHVHFNVGAPDKVDTFVQTCRENETVAAMSGGLRYGGHDYLPNEQVLVWCRKYPDCLVPMAKLDLWDKTDVDQVYRYAEAGFKGFKCIYPYFAYDDDAYMPVYEAVEKCGLPMLFHTGCFFQSAGDAVWRRPVLRNMDPVCLDRIARSFPNARIVMAHLGTSVWRHEAAELIKFHPNLFADLAGTGSWKAISPGELNALMLPLLATSPTDAHRNMAKLVLGSDAYIDYPHLVGDARRGYEQLLDANGAPPEIRRGVLGATAASWFGIELE